MAATIIFIMFWTFFFQGISFFTIIFCTSLQGMRVLEPRTLIFDIPLFQGSFLYVDHLLFQPSRPEPKKTHEPPKDLKQNVSHLQVSGYCWCQLLLYFAYRAGKNLEGEICFQPAVKCEIPLPFFFLLLKMDAWKIAFFLGRPIFSFREGIKASSQASRS